MIGTGSLLCKLDIAGHRVFLLAFSPDGKLLANAEVFQVVARRSPATLGRVSDVTRILGAVQQGDSAAAKDLLPLVYEELRRLARSKMAQQASDPSDSAAAALAVLACR